MIQGGLDYVFCQDVLFNECIRRVNLSNNYYNLDNNAPLLKIKKYKNNLNFHK